MNRFFLLLLLAPTTVGATEPQIAFVVEGPFAKFKLAQDGQPVEGTIRVFDGAGNSFAEGESEGGRGGFPVPRGDVFTLEVKIGDRSADAITLTRDGNTITPANVLLSFGLKPCCRVPSRGVYRPGDTPAAGSLPMWLMAGGAGLSILVGSALVFFALRPVRSEP